MRQDGLAHTVESHLNKYIEEHEGQLPPGGLYKRILNEVERPLISCILKAADGNKAKTAEVLGITRNTLRKKMDELNIG